MLPETEREYIVLNGRNVYLEDGLRASLAGWKIEGHCGVHSARPGFWHCRWETARAVLTRPDRRFLPGEVWCSNPGGWFGLPLTRAEYETEQDYQAAVTRGEAE